LNLELSGTESARWEGVGALCVALWIILFASGFGARLPPPIGPLALPFAILTGIGYVLLKIKRPHREPSVIDF